VTVDLNGNYIKEAHGGDPLIGRGHGMNETKFVVQFTPFVMSNDMNKIIPADDAVPTVCVAQCMRSFADNPVYTTELKGHSLRKSHHPPMRAP
jgi:acyl-coenzyme A thioesterase PaaI-like protein